jgi:hypothetical protein
MVEPDLGTRPIGEVVSRQRLAAEVIDAVGRRLFFLGSERGLLVLQVRASTLVDAVRSMPELISRRLAPDRGCDCADLVLVQRRPALQTVGLYERGEDDRP